MKLFPGGRNRGISTLEVIVALTLLSGVVFSLVFFIKDCFHLWRKASYRIEIERNAVIALDQMSEYIRKGEAKSLFPKVGIETDFVSFYYLKEDGKKVKIKYYKEKDKLVEVMGGRKRILVPYGVKDIKFKRIGERFLRIYDFVVKIKDKEFNFSRNIYIRG
ncbi:MAG: hypothetical protein DRI36_05025 [Caldiserica bacterium]|mgnify:CR=1 FL=1|nr:MAG: hypothetical protein DRI36_05025 [Caldisericota bacterium]